jgi:23S rRNA (guanosine2251-2'-O)-methyltransferase
MSDGSTARRRSEGRRLGGRGPRSRDAGPGADHRRSDREVVIGGRRAVAETVRAGLAREVLLVPGGRSTPGLRDALAESERRGVPVTEITRDKLDALSRDHQGIAVRARMPRVLGGGDLRWLTAHPDPDAVVVVLDGITDPQNLGAAARAAEAAGVSVLVTRERRAAGLTVSAVRASAGALLHLPLARVTNLTRSLEMLQEGGFTVVGLDEHAGRSTLDGPCPDGPVAIVVGSEGSGLSRLVRETCDLTVRLPMRGKISSLNAASALSAALFGYVLPSRAGPDAVS